MTTAIILLFAIFSFLGFCWVGIYFFSQKKTFISPVVNGEIMVATWNKLPRKFFGQIAPGTYIDEKGDKQDGERHVDTRTGRILPGPRTTSFLERKFGIVWIGFPPYGRIHKWKLSYTKWERQESGIDKMVVVKDKTVDSLHPRPTFAFAVKEAETADKVPINIEGKYTLSLINAMTAIFSNRDWIANIEAAIIATIVDYLKTMTYDIFMEDRIELGADFIPEIMSINTDGHGNQSIGRYGFMLEDISITSIEVGGSARDEITKATTAVKVAREQAKARVKEAEGLAKAAVKQAEGVKALCEALGPNSDQIGLLKIAEALRDQKNPWALGGGMLPTMDLTKKP
jgi:hypothetical protein